MGIRCWKFTDGETVSGQASQDLGNYCNLGMIFKGLESTLRDIKSTWQWKWQGNWEVMREWTAKLLEGKMAERNQRMKNHANYFENPGQVNRNQQWRSSTNSRESYYNETKSKEISIKKLRGKGGGSEQRWRWTRQGGWKIEESQRDWKCSLKHVEAALD